MSGGVSADDREKAMRGKAWEAHVASLDHRPGLTPREHFDAGWDARPGGVPAHDHSGDPKVWCETHQHTHIASIPRFTFHCKSCGFGGWYKPDAEAHEASCAGHETYAVEHVVRPLGTPARPTREALADEAQCHWPDWNNVGSTSVPCACGAEVAGVTWPAFYLHLADALLAADHLWAERPSDAPWIGDGDRPLASYQDGGIDEEVIANPRHTLAATLRWHADNLAEDDAYEAIRTDLRTAADALSVPSAPVVDREALEEWSFAHRPVTSMKDGSIAGCTCLDRVFVSGAEDWDSHITAELIASGLFVDRATVEAEQREKDAQIAEGRHNVAVGADSSGNVMYMATARFPDDGRRVAAAIRASGSASTDARP